LEIVATVLSVNRKERSFIYSRADPYRKEDPGKGMGDKKWNALAREETKFPSLLIHRHFTIYEITVSYSENYYMIIARRK
jgi:hypothetical protein